MKAIYRILSLLAITAITFSCNESEDLVTADAQEGGLVEPSSTALNYVVGNTGPYALEMFLNQRADVAIQEISIYNTFSGTEILADQNGDDSVGTYTTNSVLLKTVPVTITTAGFVSPEVSYDELIAGLVTTRAGSPGLPSSDGDLQIGDRWTLSFEFKLADGRTVDAAFNVNLAVSTRFAGTYNITAKQYWRIGVNRSDLDALWPATLAIGSVDAVSYEQIEWCGPFNGNTLFFQIDPATLVISYPLEFKGVAQVINDVALATCADNAADLVNIQCGSSNFAVEAADGKDVMTMSYGYVTPGSGPREFYQVLVKAL